VADGAPPSIPFEPGRLLHVEPMKLSIRGRGVGYAVQHMSDHDTEAGLPDRPGYRSGIDEPTYRAP